EAKEINDQCKGNELKSDDIAKMVLLDSFVKEALRLNADLLGVPHKCLSEPYYTFSNGYQIPNGRVIMLNFLEITGDEELQGQNPQQFNAYRHLERNSNATKLERNFVIFGSGKHACPGRFYAVRVMKIFFHKIILKYHIRAETEKISKKHIGSLIAPLKTNIVFENRD
ncbi:16154_t:CDS:2, partial [Cetraspora pellucida]